MPDEPAVIAAWGAFAVIVLGAFFGGLIRVITAVNDIKRVVGDPVTGMAATHNLANSNLETVEADRKELIVEVARLNKEARTDAITREAHSLTPASVPTEVVVVDTAKALPVIVEKHPDDKP